VLQAGPEAAATVRLGVGLGRQQVGAVAGVGADRPGEAFADQGLVDRDAVRRVGVVGVTSRNGKKHTLRVR